MALRYHNRPAPSHWSDGLNWESPVMGDVRYLQALQLALLERCAAPEASNYGRSYVRSTWYATPSGTAYNFMKLFFEALSDICGCYIIPKEYGNYAEDLSDFPKFWNIKELLRVANARCYPILPTQGVPYNYCAENLRLFKEMLSLLTLAEVKPRASYYNWVEHHNYGGGDMGFSEAMNEAFDIEKNDWNSPNYLRVRLLLYSYTTADVWGVQYEGEEDASIYNETALADRAVKIHCVYGGEAFQPETVVLVYSTLPESPALNGEECSVTYDAADTGFEEGITEFRYPYGTKDIVLHAPLGSVPRTSAPPQGGWVTDEDGDKEMPLSYSRKGFNAEAHVYLDFTNCFNFP